MAPGVQADGPSFPWVAWFHERGRMPATSGWVHPSTWMDASIGHDGCIFPVDGDTGHGRPMHPSRRWVHPSQHTDASSPRTGTPNHRYRCIRPVDAGTLPTGWV